ncbi:exonuclease domain-containing protein [Shewanella sp. 0m-11]
MQITYTKDALTQLLLNHDYLVVIDIEHTCTADGSIPPNEREIIEVAAILVSTKNLKSISGVSEFNSFVSPERHPNLSRFCSELTGISQSQVMKAENFSQVFNDFKMWLPEDNSYIFSCWGGYDLIQINIDCTNHGLEEFNPTTVINLKKAFAKTQQLKTQVGLRRALELSGVNIEGTLHRAIYDARNTVKLLPQIFR